MLLALLSQVFLSLSFYEDLGRSEKDKEKNKVKNKKGKKRKNVEEPSQLPNNDKKRNKREVMTKMREEVFLYLVICLFLDFKCS